MNNYILFKIHRWRDGCVRRFLRLCKDLENHSNYKVYALFDKAEEPLPIEMENHPSIAYMNRDSLLSLCKDGRYYPRSCRMCNDPVKSAARSLLPLLQFSKVNDADYYWQVEYDVFFNGNWSNLFNAFENSKSDFISAYIDKDNLYTSKASTLKLEGVFDENTVKYTSLNCICRISKRLTNGLLDGYAKGMYGHYETVVPTRCVQLFGEESLEDISAKPFCKEENFNKFYTPRIMDGYKVVRDFGFSGGIKDITIKEMEPNRLYHSIKVLS